MSRHVYTARRYHYPEDGTTVGGIHVSVKRDGDAFHADIVVTGTGCMSPATNGVLTRSDIGALRDMLDQVLQDWQ